MYPEHMRVCLPDQCVQGEKKALDWLDALDRLIRRKARPRDTVGIEVERVGKGSRWCKLAFPSLLLSCGKEEVKEERLKENKKKKESKDL